MSRDTCRGPHCENTVGEQERDDYNARKYCSIQCELSYEHIKADARDAMADELRAAEERDERHPGERGEFL